MRAAARAVWPAAVALGIAAEAAGRPPLPALDAATGFSLVALGFLAWRRQPRYAVGWILAAAGVAWFIGTLAAWAVFLHRAPLAQLILTYPATRLWPASRNGALAAAAAYAYAAAYPVAENSAATTVFALALVGLAAWRYQAGGGLERRARASALAAAAAFGSVLIASAIEPVAGASGGRPLLAAYEAVIVLLAAGLTADLLWGRWAQGLVTALVVDLGDPAAAGTLRARLAHTLGDPTLTVGYWVTGQDGYVDETGLPLELPAGDRGRAVRLIDDAGAPLAALIHDPAILNDPALLTDIAAATRLAVANARLQAQIRAKVAQVSASRRRLVEAADEQRRQLERDLHEGAEKRLTKIAELLAGCSPPFAEITAGLGAARAELRELAHGIHPATLTDAGLHAALQELAARSPAPVELTIPPRRWPTTTEAAAYFLCSEALANTAKYAQASHVSVLITSNDDALRVEIADDGTGGADAAGGSGLRGLADRVEALGGRLTIISPPGQGTRLTAELPLSTPGQPASADPAPGPDHR